MKKKWGYVILTVLLVILFVWVSGCVNTSLGSKQVADFGTTKDAQQAQNWFIEKYGNPYNYTGSPRFLEPMVSDGIVNDIPTDKVSQFSQETPRVYFWAFYEGFNKGDSVTATWTFQDKQFATLTKPVGGNFGIINATFDKPKSGWALGTHTITISGNGVQNSTKFDIIAGNTVTVPLPFGTKPPSPDPLNQEVAKKSGSNLAQGVVAVGNIEKKSVSNAVAPALDAKSVQNLSKQGVVSAQGQSPVLYNKLNPAGMCGPDQHMTKAVCYCDDATLKACDSGCVNHIVDHNNCGDCGITCGPDQECKGGSCECNIGGTTKCGDKCLNLNTDINNCGTCGTVCPQNLGASKCSGGSCGCVNPAMASCPGVGCVDLLKDRDNCGACGLNCTHELPYCWKGYRYNYDDYWYARNHSP